MRINPSIFKENDIRGIYPDEINEKAVYKIGNAFAQSIKNGGKRKIVVGRDRRKSSKSLFDHLVRGAADAGVDVIDIGETFTPMLYFAIRSLKASGGLMVTASHNPLNYNGVKISGKNAMTIGGMEMKKLVKLKNVYSKRKGGISKHKIKTEYLNAVDENFSSGEALDKSRKKIKISHSFDYDGDRLIIRDKNKKRIRGDIIGGIIGGAIAKKGDIVVCDILCSRAIQKYFRNKGVKTVPSKVGEFNIKNLMKKKRAIFGMEMSGHYYFEKFNYCESPDFALRIIKEHMLETGKSLEELIKPFAGYYHSGVLNFPARGVLSASGAKSAKGWEKITAEIKNTYKNGAVNFMDGITVEFSNWWFNLRPSNTEPLLRLVVEANSEKLLRQKKKELKVLLAAFLPE